MSSGLMSCVRENSPPIDNGVEETSGPFSLPVSHSTSFSPTPNCRQSDMHFNDTVSSLAENNLPVEVDVSNAEAKATPNTDNKRRRFQPFRNLRRLFRRRTISSSVHDKPRPTEHDKDYNDRRGSSSATARVVRDIARDKFKISTENREQEQLKFENSYSAQTLPKNSCCDTLNPINRSLIKIWESANNPLSSDACNRCQKLSELKSEEDVMYATTSRAGSQTLPVSFVMYNNSNNYAMNAEKLSTTKRDSLNDFKRKSSQESESDSKTSAKPLSSSSNDGVDITDNQYTMSEDRLLNSACSQEPLSQSHDSVFSESATASSFSSVLKAELADVLRKRRNRPDASDEDLGLPRSPTSPRRLNDAQALQTHTLANLQSNTESCDDLFCTSTANNSFATQYETAPVEERISSRNCHRIAQINVAASNNKRHTISSSAFQEIADELDAPRLSHDGAKHKIALRQKKKAPTRLQRRTLDMSIPEMNENFVKIPATRAFFEDSKLKTTNMEHTFPPLTNSHGSTNLAQFYRKRNRDQLNAPFIENTPLPAYSIRTITTKSEQRAQAARPELSVSKDNLENVFLRTVALRSSFRSLNKDEDEFDSQAKKLHISSTNYDVKEELKQHTPKKSSDFLMNMQLLNSESKPALSTPTKAKSGPEARQRYAPISLNFPEPDNSATLSNCQHVIRAQKEKEKLKSTAMIKHIVSVQQSVREVNDLDFELSPRTVNMQAYKRKPYSACEKSEEEEEATLRKPVEKSRSFKLAGNVANNNNNNKNMPSLPDLSGKESENRYFVKTSPTQDKSVSLGFEINDNNLMRRSVPVATKCQLKITPQTSKSAMDLSNSKVLLPQNGGSSSSNRDINEIEQNIDMIVKSTPYISIVERRVEPNSSKSSEDLTRASKTNRPNRLSLKMEPSESLLNLMPIPIKEKKTQEEKPLMNVFKIEVEKNKTKNKENLPEFLKIQLTPIDSAEKASEHVVLAKNVRSTSMKEASPSPSASSNGTTTTSINSDSRDGSISPISKRFLELKRHDSNESIEIKEKSVPPKKLVEAVNGDARALVNNFLARNSLKSNTELPKETRNPVNPIKPGVHNLRSFSLQERRRIFLQDEPSKTVTVGDLSKPAAVVKKAEEMTTPTTPNTPNTPKTPNTPTTPTTPNTPTVKSKVEVLKSVVAKTKERQVTKSVAKTTTVSGLANNESTTGFTTETKPRMPKPATTESKPIATTTPTPTTPTTPSETPAVVLRKKPAASSLPITGKLQLASSPRKMSSRNDEPELMKVFARRSLKVKDEDVNNLNEKIQAHNYASSRRTICGMDSDKENQSASIERLNKLMQLAADREQNEDKETNNNNNNNNNNDIIVAKNSNNNNNNGINSSTPLSPTKVITPTHENNKLNNNNASNSFAKPKVDNVDLSNGNAVQNGFIAPRGKSQAMQERTATMGEFKNINQRRAEWEQRAKGVKN